METSMDSRFGSARKSSPGSKPTTDGLPTLSNLREEHEEKQRLEKSNFDLKMKVYYLEENLKRFQEGEHAGDVQTEHLRQENAKLKLMIEDKQVDLEQRNLLLIKSKNAIEALKVEIDRLRADNNHQQDLEDRIRRLKQLNEDIENDYRAQISQLEQQLQAARQLVDAKEIERVTSEDKVSHLEISYGQIDNHLKDVQQEKRRLQEQLVIAQQKIQALEEEGTQNRAHMDLYRIQVEETAQERDAIKEKLRQEQLAKLKAEEDGKIRLSDCTKHYESQIRTMRINHEQDMEKIRTGHMEMLADVRENYQAELARAKQDLERTLGDVRSSDAQDLQRMKENFSVRIEEKNEEIKSLRSMMAAESQRLDSLLHEMDTIRQQLRDKTQLAERLAAESAAKSEELKVLPKIMKDLDECRVNFGELQRQHQQERQDKTQLSTQLEHVTAALEAAQSELRQRDHALQTAQVEAARLSKDVSTLSVKADGIEHISRDNERLKGVVARLETDNLSLTHKVEELRRELEHSHQEIAKIAQERDIARDNLRVTQGKLDAALDQNNAVQIVVQTERERRSAAEAALSETRSVLAQSRDELQAERTAKLTAERRAQQCEEDEREMRNGLGQACVMSFHAMQEWDDTLSAVLDGELFSGIMRGAAAAMNSGRDFGSVWQQMQSPSAHYRSPVRGQGGTSSHGDDRGVEQLLAMPVDQLLQRVAVRVERVGLKLQRTEKIRSLFVTQAEKLVDILQQGMQVSQERITLYQHKLTDAQTQLQKLKNTVQRDRKQRDEETQELMRFKEVVLSQHTAQLRDSEIRFAQVTQQLEHERARSDELQRQVASQSEELRSLQQINQRMHEDLAVLERTESVVHDLSARVGELGELNRSMSKDLAAKTDAVAQLTHDNGELKLELSSMVARAESLLQQVRSRDEAIETSETKLQGLMREMERLRSRQIHPDLAKTILDTQSILQTAVRGGGGSGSGPAPVLPSSAVAPVYSRGSAGDKIGEYLAQVDRLEGAVADLIRRTSEMVAGFETQMGNARVTRGAAALSALKQEIYELLDANSTLTVQVQQLLAEFKKGIRQLNLSLGSGDSHGDSRGADVVEPSASSRRAPVSPILANGNARSFDSYRTEPFSPVPKFSSMSLNSPIKLEGVIEPQYSSSIRGNAFSSTQRVGATGGLPDYSSSSTRVPQTPEVVSSTAKAARFHSSPGTAAPVGAVAMSTTLSQESSRSALDLPVRPTGAYPLGTSLSASMAAYTPNTASRMSTSRLNKLGSDLEALARKLDSYDTSRTK